MAKKKIQYYDENGQPVKIKKKHYWWRFLLVFFAGVLFIPVVASAGVIVISTQIKTGDAIRFVGQDPDQVLTDEYQDSTLFQIIMDFASGKVAPNTIEGISEITPIIDNTLNQIIDDADFSDELKAELHALVNKLRTVSFDQLGDQAFDLATNGISLSSLIDENMLGEDSPFKSLIHALLYKENGDKITIKNVLDDGIDFNKALDALELRDFISGDFSGTVFEVFVDRLLYKDNGGEKVPVTIADLMNDSDFFVKAFDQDFINSIAIDSLITIADDANPILKSLKNKTIGDLQSDEFINTIEIADVMGIDRSDLTKYSNVMLTLCFKKDTAGEYIVTEGQGRTLGDFTKEGGIDNIINDIKLGDIFTSDSGLFNSFKDLTIKDLSDDDVIKNKINEVKIKDIIGDNKTNPIVESIMDATIGELQGEEYFDTKTLGEVLGLDETTTGILAKLKNKTLKQLSDGEILDGITISDAIDEDQINSSPILKAIKDFEITEINQNSFDGIKLWDVLGITNSDSSILKALENSTVGSLNDDINNMTIGDFLTEADLASSKLLQSLSSKKVNELNADTINNLKFEEVFEITETSPAVMKALKAKNATIGNLTSVIDTLKISDVLDCGESKILGVIKDCLITDSTGIENAINGAKIKTFLPDKAVYKYKSADGSAYSNTQEPGYVKNPDYTPILGALADIEVGNLDTEINNIKIKDLFDEPDTTTVFGKILAKMSDSATFGNAEQEFSQTIDNMTLDELVDDCSSSTILNAIKDYKFSELSDAIKNLKITEVFHDDIYLDGAIHGIWKYLLKDPSGTRTADSYTVNELGVLVTNVTSNIQSAKIKDLIADGIFSAPAGLIDKYIVVGGTPTKVGDLTLTQFFNAFNLL